MSDYRPPRDNPALYEQQPYSDAPRVLPKQSSIRLDPYTRGLLDALATEFGGQWNISLTRSASNADHAVELIARGLSQIAGTTIGGAPESLRITRLDVEERAGWITARTIFRFAQSIEFSEGALENFARAVRAVAAYLVYGSSTTSTTSTTARLDSLSMSSVAMESEIDRLRKELDYERWKQAVEKEQIAKMQGVDSKYRQQPGMANKPSVPDYSPDELARLSMDDYRAWKEAQIDRLSEARRREGMVAREAYLQQEKKRAEEAQAVARLQARLARDEAAMMAQTYPSPTPVPVAAAPPEPPPDVSPINTARFADLLPDE